MTCNTSATPTNIVRFDVNEAESYLSIGDKWLDGPNATLKDVRYYFNTSLDSTDMAAIKAAVS